MNNKSIYLCSNYNEYTFKTKRIWRTDRVYEPFVYVIREVETGIKYIGSRTQYVDRKCLESDLGTIYFTSSKILDWKSHHSKFEIIKIISCASNHDAIILESMMIDEANAVYSEQYYNKSKAGKIFNSSGNIMPDEARAKISEAQKKSWASGRKPAILDDASKRTKSSKISASRVEYYKNRSEEERLEKSNKISKIRKIQESKVSAEEREIRNKKTGEGIKKYYENLSEGEKQEHSNRIKDGHRKMSEDAKIEKRRKQSLKALNRDKKKCPWCQKTVDPGNYSRHHGDRCKSKNIITLF